MFGCDEWTQMKNSWKKNAGHKMVGNRIGEMEADTVGNFPPLNTATHVWQAPSSVWGVIPAKIPLYETGGPLHAQGVIFWETLVLYINEGSFLKNL